MPHTIWAILVVLPLALSPPLHVGAFSEATPGATPSGWESMSLGRADATAYSVVRQDGTNVVQAVADRSASGLVRRLDVDPAAYPVLEWSWRVENVVPDGSTLRKRGDDSPARLYVTFDYDPSNFSFGDRLKYEALQAFGGDDVPTRALVYIWANHPNETEPVANPFSDWVMMVPVDRGSAYVGQWREHRRNVLEDYRAVFGEEPPAITGIAIMTDTDNTGDQATAYYGDIRLLPAGG